MKFDYAIRVLESERKEFYIDNDTDKQLKQAIKILESEGIGKRKPGHNKLIYDKYKKKIVSVSPNGDKKEVLDITLEETNNI